MFYLAELQLKNVYKNCYDSLLKDTKTRLKDSKKLKSNSLDPHSKIVAITQVHRLLFTGSYSVKFELSEKSLAGIDSKRSSPSFRLKTLKRVKEVFSGSVAKVHGSGDVTLITPWYHAAKNI